MISSIPQTLSQIEVASSATLAIPPSRDEDALTAVDATSICDKVWGIDEIMTNGVDVAFETLRSIHRVPVQRYVQEY